MLLRYFLLIELLTSSPLQATEQEDQPEQRLPAPPYSQPIDSKIKPQQPSPAPTPQQADSDKKKRDTRQPPLQLLGQEVQPGSSQTLSWFSSQLPGSFVIPIPVLVVHGSQPGPSVCITSAIHGDELNGIEINRRVIHSLSPDKVRGTVISVPVVNLSGLWRGDRYLSDRRDLNRFFPGQEDGSATAQVAYQLFHNIISHCDTLVDLHTGSLARENWPQLRADLTQDAIAEMVTGFGPISVLQSLAPAGSLRGAATAAGIPTVVMEVGGPMRLNTQLVGQGVDSLNAYLSSAGVIKRQNFFKTPQPIFYQSSWIRARSGGILINQVELGGQVKRGQILGEIHDPINNSTSFVEAPFAGVMLGRAQNQFVSPGYALFHIGKRRSLEELERQGEADKQSVIEQSNSQMGLTTEASAASSSATKPDTH
ncbi:MAG: succinylglutamate desuccinylase/aspartoacylase family protein [Halopseudomonas sp.]